MNKIGIIQTAFIGDVVLSTSLIETLHHHYQNAKVDIIVKKGNEGLFHNHPYINKVIVWDKSKNKYIHWLKILLEIRKYRYDLLINIQRFSATGLWLFLSKAKITIGFNKNPLSFSFTHSITHKIDDESHHEINRNHLLTSPLGDLKLLPPILYPSKQDVELIKPYIVDRYICIAPASVWYTKQFPTHKWIQLINEINFDGTIYLIGGKDDIECSKEIEKGFIKKLSSPKKLVNLTGELSFLSSAALQKNAVLNYVNDSAPLHFASSVNAPVVVVYCSTIRNFGYGPLSQTSFIVESNLSLDCRPCGLHGKKKCPKGHFNCANSIQMNQLIEPLKMLTE